VCHCPQGAGGVSVVTTEAVVAEKPEKKEVAVPPGHELGY
jgi:hypothetical protein